MKPKKVEIPVQGTPLLWLLGLLFVGLKLTDHIDWSWWLVLLPFYAPLLLSFGLVMIVMIIVFLSVLFGDSRS